MSTLDVFAHTCKRLQLAQHFPTPSAASLYIINNKESALQMLLHCKALNDNQEL